VSIKIFYNPFNDQMMSPGNFLQRQKELLFRFRNRIKERLDKSSCRIEQFDFQSVIPDGVESSGNFYLQEDLEILKITE